MAYLDDWSHIDPEDKRKLQQQCEVCLHYRYLHGKAREVRVYNFRVVEYEAGQCTSCPCSEFRADPLISKDDVLDASDKLTGDIHLGDFGISGLDCPAVIMRWIGLTSMTMHCALTGGHAGDHST